MTVRRFISRSRRGSSTIKYPRGQLIAGAAFTFHGRIAAARRSRPATRAVCRVIAAVLPAVKAEEYSRDDIAASSSSAADIMFGLLNRWEIQTLSVCRRTGSQPPVILSALCSQYLKPMRQRTVAVFHGVSELDWSTYRKLVITSVGDNWHCMYVLRSTSLCSRNIRRRQHASFSTIRVECCN